MNELVHGNEAAANPPKRADLDEFVALYNPADHHQRQATWSAENPDGRWRVYEDDELVARDKASLDIFWLKDDGLADSDNLPPPEVIAQEIVEDLEAAFGAVSVDRGGIERFCPLWLVGRSSCC